MPDRSVAKLEEYRLAERRCAIERMGEDPLLSRVSRQVLSTDKPAFMIDVAMPSLDSNSLPSAREFLKLSRIHSLVPVYRTVTADLETPVSAFLRIASEEPEAFLLESVEGGEHVGRYTFIGIRPFRTMTAANGTITETTPGSAPVTRACRRTAACLTWRAGLAASPSTSRRTATASA